MKSPALQGKKILIGVTGSVAIFKIFELIRILKKELADIRIIMTESATKLVSPQLFQALCGSHVYVHQFFPSNDSEMLSFPHICLSRWCDLFLITPATSNILAKSAHGIADDLLSSTILACEQPIIFVPAMNSSMWKHPATEENVRLLKKYAALIIEPESGNLACGEFGEGRMASVSRVLFSLHECFSPKDFLGKNLLITASATQEPLDDVRYLTNGSTGQMGYALASCAVSRGAHVTLISGPSFLKPPYKVDFISVRTAKEMLSSVKKYFPACDIFISAAAVTDFAPRLVYKGKRKKNLFPSSLSLKAHPDIVKEVSASRRKDQIVIGFSLEDSLDRARAYEKLKNKHLDAILLNSLSALGSDRVHINFVTQSQVIDIPDTSKDAASASIFDYLGKMLPL